MRPLLPIALLVVLLPFSGCVEVTQEPDHERALGTRGFMAFGYNPAGGASISLEGPGYAESSVSEQTAFAYGFIHATSDSTELYMQEASVADDGADRAVVRDVWVHGDTGIGDPRLPRMHADWAAWGTITLDKGEFALPFELGPGLSQWDAEVFVITDGVRHAYGNDDRKILTADGQEVWDPLRPEDIAYEMGEKELHMVLRSRLPAAKLLTSPVGQAGGNLHSTGTVDHRTFTSFHADATAEFRFRLQADAAFVSADAEARLYAPDGSLVAALSVGGGPVGTALATETVALADAGEYEIVVEGRGVGIRYDVTVAYAMDNLVIHCWWDRVSVGGDADEALRTMPSDWSQRIDARRP